MNRTTVKRILVVLAIIAALLIGVKMLSGGKVATPPSTP